LYSICSKTRGLAVTEKAERYDHLTCSYCMIQNLYKFHPFVTKKYYGRCCKHCA